MNDKKIATAKVIIISDGHFTEVEAALINHGDYGFKKQYFKGMSSKELHDEIVGQVFAAGAGMSAISVNTGNNVLLLKEVQDENNL